MFRICRPRIELRNIMTQAVSFDRLQIGFREYSRSITSKFIASESNPPTPRACYLAGPSLEQPGSDVPPIQSGLLVLRQLFKATRSYKMSLDRISEFHARLARF